MPLCSGVQPRARAQSAGGRPGAGGRALRLQRRAAPTHAAHAAVARKRPPARSCMMISGPPLPTLALGRSAKPALHRASRAARSARSLRQRHPHHQERQRARSRGGAHVGARARSAHAIGAERAAPGRDRAAAGARGRAARPCHGLPSAQRKGRAAPSAPSAERGARSARRRSGSLHAEVPLHLELTLDSFSGAPRASPGRLLSLLRKVTNFMSQGSTTGSRHPSAQHTRHSCVPHAEPSMAKVTDTSYARLLSFRRAQLMLPLTRSPACSSRGGSR